MVSYSLLNTIHFTADIHVKIIGKNYSNKMSFHLPFNCV